MKTGVVARFLSHYGMLVILVVLAALFSGLTIRDQEPAGGRAADSLLRASGGALDGTRAVVIVTRSGEADARFARSLQERLEKRGVRTAATVSGDPAEMRRAVEELAAASGGSAGLAAGPGAFVFATRESNAEVLRAIVSSVPALAGCPVVTPPPYRWPTFLLADNLRNVANQIAVIAIISIGMTMVILTGGIDLSVGSLIALSAVVAAGVIGHLGGENAGPGMLLAGAAAAITVCALFGAFSGLVVTRFSVPPFIATLGVMQVASGLAYIFSGGKPIYRLPESFVLLGRGVDPVLRMPWAVLLMAGLFAAAHLLMSRTVLGRYVYAVGGNAEAARLAGVRVGGVLFFVYALSGALAGLGGVIMASQLKSGAPTYGLMYELYVIAAVVVGGTSLNGGEGKILGTLIGAFIIAVIQNGMNLTNVESYTQKVVLGLVILGAVLLDRARRRGWRRRARAEH